MTKKESAKATELAAVAAGRRGRAFEETGVTGVNYWRQGGSGAKGAYITVAEDFLTALRGTQGVKVFAEMAENDPLIGGIMLVFKQLLKQIPWYVDPVSDEAEAIKDAAFVGQCKDDMMHTWPDFLDEVLTFLEYGWSWHEIVYKIRDGKDSNFSDGLIGWKKFAPRAQASFEAWDLDEAGEVLGLKQSPPPDYKSRYIPMRLPSGVLKSIHLTTQSRKRNPEGKSLLRNAYRPWYFKKRLEELEGIGVERDLTGLPVLTPPENVDLEDERHATTRAWAQTLIRNIRSGHQQGFVKPSGWTFELVPSPGKHPMDITAPISRYDKAIAVSCLSQFLLLGMERIGSFALAEVSQQLFDRCLEGWAEKLTEILNKYVVPSLFLINGKKRESYPKFTTGSVSRESLKDLSGYVFRLAGAGFLDPGDEDLKTFLRRYGPFKHVGRNRT